MTALDTAKEIGETILTIRLYCSHKMQPQDVSVYKLLKSYHAATMDSRLLLKPGIPLIIYDIGSLVDTAFKRSIAPSNIHSGFKRTRTFHFDYNIFHDSDFVPCAVTDRPSPKL